MAASATEFVLHAQLRAVFALEREFLSFNTNAHLQVRYHVPAFHEIIDRAVSASECWNQAPGPDSQRQTVGRRRGTAYSIGNSRRHSEVRRSSNQSGIRVKTATSCVSEIEKEGQQQPSGAVVSDAFSPHAFRSEALPSAGVGEQAAVYATASLEISVFPNPLSFESRGGTGFFRGMG